MKRANYKSKLLKSLILYIDDDTDESDGYEFNNLIIEQFPDKRDVFRITDEQFDKNTRLYNKIKSNFFIPNYGSKTNKINLSRLIGLPKNYTVREEYVRCGKVKRTNVNHYNMVPIITHTGEKNFLMRIILY